MKTLHLNLHSKWFKMILLGAKKEEYRELKPYWAKRLVNEDGTFKEFSSVTFSNGYSKNRPQMVFEIKEIKIDTGYVVWGAKYNKAYYVIKLGEMIFNENC